MDIHQARLILEHQTLPRFVLEGKGPFIKTLVESKGSILYGMMQEICSGNGIECDLDARFYTATAGKLEDGYYGMIIGFPSPKVAPLCFRAVVIFDENCEDIGYFTIERKEDGTQKFGEYVISKAGEMLYKDHGEVPDKYEDELNKAILLYCQKDKVTIKLV